MKYLYEKLYYRMYKIMKIIERDESNTHLSAILLYSAIQLQNLFLLMLISMYLGLFEGGIKMENGEAIFLILSLGIVFFNWLIIIKNGRYKLIIAKESKLDHRKSNLIIDFVLVTSWALLFILAKLVDIQ